MQNSVIIKMDKVIAYPYRELWNELGVDSIKEREEFFLAPIYFACRTKKVFFNLDETYIVYKNKLRVSLVCANEAVTRDVPIYEALTDHGKFQDLGRIIFENSLHSGHTTVTLNKERSSITRLHFDVETLTGSYTSQVTPENFVEKCELFRSEKAEVIYVGKSMRLITDRAKEHKKVLDIIESYETDYSIRLYFVSLRIFALGSSIPRDHYILKVLESISPQDRGLKIDLAERMLVFYFKPELNRTFKNWNYKNDRHIKKIKKEGIETLCLDVGMDAGPLYQFYSKAQLFSSDEAYLNLDNLTTGFISKENFKIKLSSQDDYKGQSAVMYKSYV